MGINLTGIIGDLSNALPDKSDLINQIIAGAAGTVVLSGLKTDAGQEAVDPFHLFHHPSQTSTVIGKSITASAFKSLDPASQAQILSAGYVIVG